jgi:signal transduction histidine kinase
VLDVAREVGGADHGSLILFGSDGQVQEHVTCDVVNEQRHLDRAMVDRGIVGRVVRDGQVVRLPRLGEDPSVVGFPRNRRTSGSATGPFLGLPISLWGTVFGAICLGRREGAPEFDEEDEHEMALLGAQAGVALDHARLLQESKARERALVAVKEVTHSILDGSDTDEVLRLVAASARDLAGATMAFVNAPDESGQMLVLRAAVGERAEPLVGMTFPASRSISGEVMQSRQPLVVEDAAADPRVYQPVVRLGHVGPALFVPLAVGNRVFGTLSVANEPGGRRLSPDDVLLLQTFAAEAAIALQYGQIHAELERLTLLDERERIAMDLHDGVIQALFVVGLSLQAAQEVVDDADEVAIRLADAVGSIDRTIRDLRDYIFGLQPSERADHELDRALRDVALVFQRSGLVTAVVDVDPKAAAIMSPHAATLTHIAREAMSNAVRHSGCTRVTVALRLSDSHAVLEVSDNGSGFDLVEAEGKGNGLFNLRARADALGGCMEIESTPGAGSTVRLRVQV